MHMKEIFHKNHSSNESSGINSPNYKKIKTNPHFDQSTFSQLHHKIKHAKSENKISQFNLDEYKEKIIKFSLKVEEKRKKEQINANYNDFQKKSNLTEISSRDDLFGLYDQIHEEYFLEKKGLLYYSNKYERSLQKKFKPRNWTKNDQILLLWTIENYCFLSNLTTENLKHNDWRFISSLIPFKNDEQCKTKFFSLRQSNIKSSPWDDEEEKCLMSIIRNKMINKIKWSDIAKELEEKCQSKFYKTPKLCRERWNNYLNPELKKFYLKNSLKISYFIRGNWEAEEDILILKKVLNMGKKWSEISKSLPGRNENSVKNRFFSLLKKEKKKNAITDQANSFSTTKASTEMVPEDQEVIQKLILELEKNGCKDEKEQMVRFSSIYNFIIFLLFQKISKETKFELPPSFCNFNANSLKQEMPYFPDLNANFPSYNRWENMMQMEDSWKNNNNSYALNFNAFNAFAETKQIAHSMNSLNLENVGPANCNFPYSFKNLEENMNQVNSNAIKSYKNLEEINRFTTMNSSERLLKENPHLNLPKNSSESFIKTPHYQINGLIGSSESLKEIKIMEKLKHSNEEEKYSQTEIPQNYEYFIKLKVININNLNYKNKPSSIFHAIVDMTNYEIVILNQFAPTNSPKSSGSGSRNSYVSALLNLNQSFGSLKIPSNDSIKSNDPNKSINTSQKFLKEGSHFKENNYK